MGYQSEPVTMWFDRRLAMRASPVHGIGTFATDDIPAGDHLMWVTGGIVYTPDDWHSGRVRLAGEQYNEEQIGDNLLRATPLSLYYYVNHSCEPNMLNSVAWRDIAAGEEITTDYAYCESGPRVILERCGCGAASCRGRITGDDWRIPELQRRYRGYFTPYIEHLIQQAAADQSGGAAT